MIQAVEEVRERQRRAAAALERAGLAYALAEGNAAALHCIRVRPSAERNAPDVVLVLRRCDLDRAAGVLRAVGFVRRDGGPKVLFLEANSPSPCPALQVVLAGEKIRPEHGLPVPDVTEVEWIDGFRVLRLDV
jgi:hypothetical protein